MYVIKEMWSSMDTEIKDQIKNKVTKLQMTSHKLVSGLKLLYKVLF